MEYDISSSISLISHIHSVTAEFLRGKLTQKGLPDLSSSHGFILFLLSKKEKMTMREIAQNINRDKSTATVLVRKLENGGFVESSSNTADGRSKFIKLTSKGAEYNKITAELSQNLIDTFYKDFTEDEKQEVLRLLSKISSHFD